jgi:hypothetical protein
MIIIKYLNLITSLSVACFIWLGQLYPPTTNLPQDQIQSQHIGLAYSASPSSSPVQTEAIHLPIVAQKAPSTQSSLTFGEVIAQEIQATVSPTASQTPIPTQFGKENVPIVIGASVISGIIILASLLVRKFASAKNNHL